MQKLPCFLAVSGYSAAAEICILKFSIGTQIFSQTGNNLLSLLQHVEIDINHGHRCRVSFAEMCEEAVVGFLHHIFYAVAFAAKHGYGLGCRCIHHVEHIVEESEHT